MILCSFILVLANSQTVSFDFSSATELQPNSTLDVSAGTELDEYGSAVLMLFLSNSSNSNLGTDMHKIDTLDTISSIQYLTFRL